MKTPDLVMGRAYVIVDIGKTDDDQRRQAEAGHLRKGIFMGVEEKNEYSFSTGTHRNVKRPIFSFPATSHKETLPARRALEPWNAKWDGILAKVEEEKAKIAAEIERRREENEQAEVLRSVLVNQVTALLEGMGAVFELRHWGNRVTINFDLDEFKMFHTLLKMNLK